MVRNIRPSVRAAARLSRVARRHRAIALAITSAAVLVCAAPAAAHLQTTTVTHQPVTKAEINTWTREYARWRRIPTHDISGTWRRSAQAVYVPATHTYWGTVDFNPAASDSLRVKVGFQDGGGTGIFRHQAGKPWRFYGRAGVPFSCSTGVPVVVKNAFGWGTCRPYPSLAPEAR